MPVSPNIDKDTIYDSIVAISAAEAAGQEESPPVSNDAAVKKKSKKKKKRKVASKQVPAPGKSRNGVA